MIYTEDSQLRLENVNALDFFCGVCLFPPFHPPGGNGSKNNKNYPNNRTNYCTSF